MIEYAQGDQRLAHDSGRPVSGSYLESIGVLYHHCPTIDIVDKLAAERGYKNRDEVCVSPQTMGDVYEEKVKTFFSEHLHEDEEIRYIRDGEGYFDVRGQEDEWVRIRLSKDDLIILPAGIYHRFTTDDKNVSLYVFFYILPFGQRWLWIGACMLIVCSMSRLCVSSRRSPSGRL